MGKFDCRWIINERQPTRPAHAPPKSISLSGRAGYTSHHRPPATTDIAGCCVVAPERDTHDAPRYFLAPKTATHGRYVRRRRSGLTSFLWRPPCGSPHRVPARQPFSSAACSLSPEPSTARPSPASCHHNSAASDTRSVRWPLSVRWSLAAGQFRTPSCPYRFPHRRYAVWQRSDPLCSVSEVLRKS